MLISTPHNVVSLPDGLDALDTIADTEQVITI